MSDNINVKGFNTSAGTESLRNYRPSEDASVVQKLKAAGGIVIGKYLYSPWLHTDTFLSKYTLSVARHRFILPFYDPFRERKHT